MIQLHVHRNSGAGTDYLVLKRAADEPLFPGIWQVITGGIDEGESSTDAARRELFEETGLADARIFPLPYVASFYLSKSDCIHLVPVFAAEVSAGAEVRLSREHQTSAWLRFEDASRVLAFPSHKEGHRILRDFGRVPPSTDL